MKIEFNSTENSLISLPMNQLKIDAKVIDALNEQLGSIANALRMATTAQEIKEDVGGSSDTADDEHVGEANQIRPANANKVIVQCADAEEVVLNSNLFNSAELIKFISENYSNITIKLDKQGSDAFKKIVIDDALRSNPYAAPIELKAERWTDNLAKSCTIRIIEVIYDASNANNITAVIFQLIPKINVKYAHMLIFRLQNCAIDSQGQCQGSMSYLQNILIIYIAQHPPGMSLNSMITPKKLIKGCDLESEILAMLTGFYRPNILNIIHHFEKTYNKKFRFFPWYYNYNRYTDIIININENHKRYVPSTPHQSTDYHYVLFSIKPRDEISYQKELEYHLGWYCQHGHSDNNPRFYVAGKASGAFSDRSATDETVRKLFKFSVEPMDMIRQFVAIFEFELVCDAKRVEWEWNCRMHN